MARVMKDSGIEWIGEIPESWKIRKGKWILEHLERPVLPDDGVITCFRDGEVTLRSNRREDGFTFSLQEAGYQGIEPGDLVVHGMDGFAGAIGISDSRGKGTPVLNVLDSTENKKYLTFFLRTMAHNGIFLALSTGIRVRSCDTNWNKLKELQYILPPSDEQERIVAFLDRKCAEIDAVIERTKTTIEEYKKLKQAVITEAVTKGVRGPRPMKDSGIEWIGEIPEAWEVKVAFQLFQQVKCKNEGTVEQNLLSLSYGKIKRKRIDTVGGLLPESFDGYNIIEADDIVLRLTDLQNDQTSLRVGLSHERGIVTSAYLTLRNQSNNLPIYLYYYLHTFDVCKGFYGMGAGVRQGINWDGLKLLKIVLPPTDEQAEITNYLEGKSAEIDNLIAKKTALLTELETYKKSLIYEYVTGKKECIEVLTQEQPCIAYPFFPAAVNTDKPRFAQAVLMSKILDSNVKQMGRVKLEKMLYTIENSIGFDFDTEYVREAAGPLHSSIYECEGIIGHKNKWFTMKQSQYGVSYTPTSSKDKYKKYYDKYFSDYDAEINRIISVFRDYTMDQAEIVATLFAAWNDAIIDQKHFTDDDIVDDVLNNWHENKKRFAKEVWLRAMAQMKQNCIVPKGYGKRTVRRKEYNA